MTGAIIILASLGVVFCVIGYFIWKKEKISLLHDYHRNNVAQEDIPSFCRLSGLGVISIGIGLLITAVIIGCTNSAWAFLAFAIGFSVGLALLIYAGSKYNTNKN